MKVGKISRASNSAYIPLQDRLLTSLLSKANKAKREGRSEVSMVMKDSPAMWKAIDAASRYFDIYTEKSDSVKVTIKL